MLRRRRRSRPRSSRWPARLRGAPAARNPRERRHGGVDGFVQPAVEREVAGDARGPHGGLARRVAHHHDGGLRRRRARRQRSVGRLCASAAGRPQQDQAPARIRSRASGGGATEGRRSREAIIGTHTGELDAGMRNELSPPVTVTTGDIEGDSRCTQKRPCCTRQHGRSGRRRRPTVFSAPADRAHVRAARQSSARIDHRCWS